jgi:hypothetical protein
MPKSCYGLFIIFITSIAISFGQTSTISGMVKDRKNEPLSFATIYIKGTTVGTTANANGFYSLNLKPGKYELVFKYIGYKMHVEILEVGANDITLNIALISENLSLKEIHVSANAEDPAYAIIREAIKKRKFYLEQVEAYSCNVYIIYQRAATVNKISGKNTGPESGCKRY